VQLHSTSSLSVLLVCSFNGVWLQHRALLAPRGAPELHDGTQLAGVGRKQRDLRRLHLRGRRGCRGVRAAGLEEGPRCLETAPSGHLFDNSLPWCQTAKHPSIHAHALKHTRTPHTHTHTHTRTHTHARTLYGCSCSCGAPLPPPSPSTSPPSAATSAPAAAGRPTAPTTGPTPVGVLPAPRLLR